MVNNYFVLCLRQTAYELTLELVGYEARVKERTDIISLNLLHKKRKHSILSSSTSWMVENHTAEKLVNQPLDPGFRTIWYSLSVVNGSPHNS